MLSEISRGVIAGTVIGIILFINLPTFLEFTVFTLLTSAIFGCLFWIRAKYSRKAFIGALVIFLAGPLLLLIFSINCPLIDMSGFYDPARNPVTGETDLGGFDGFRFYFGCGNPYPWYYQDLDMNRTEYCQKIEDEASSYCPS